jgi:hypothetical protein
MSRHKKSALVPSLQKRVLYAATLGLWLTGMVWVLRSLNAPGQSVLMKIHGALAMVFLSVFGTLVFEHVPMGWLQNERRRSGLPLLAACGVLIITGWGLYYLGSDVARLSAHWIHLIVGALFPVLIVLHIYVQKTKPKTKHDLATHHIAPAG